MNTYIKQFKTELLEKVKAQRTQAVNRKDALVQAKFAQKKVVVDEESVKLDQAFAQYRTERENSLRKEIEVKLQEVQKKKAALLQNAQASAETEAANEIAIEVSEYDAEIAKLEKELQ